MRKYIAPFALVLLVMLGTLAVVLIGRLPVPEAASLEAPIQQASTDASTRVDTQYDLPGVPAIKPSRPGHMPAVTMADIHTYFHIHPLAPGVDDSKITHILLIPSKQAVSMMNGEPTGIADNELVYLIEFNVNAYINMLRPNGEPEPFLHTEQRVYNAATGNLLVWGGK